MSKSNWYWRRFGCSRVKSLTFETKPNRTSWKVCIEYSWKKMRAKKMALKVIREHSSPLWIMESWALVGVYVVSSNMLIFLNVINALVLVTWQTIVLKTSDHIREDCASELWKCVNCVQAKDSLKLSLSVNRSPFDSECPC